MNPGYIWVPYIIAETIPVVVSGTFSPNSSSSRYSTKIIITKNQIRKSKIEKILNEKPSI